MTQTINAQEVENFEKMSQDWWDENGPCKPLHRLNPTRMAYLRQAICEHFDLPQEKLKALQELKAIDIGCGGGLVCEPLSRMGADVTGLDAAAGNIDIAKEHAKKHGLDITYLHKTAEEHVKSRKKYDIVLALEIVEHVENLPFFIETAAKLLKKDGILILSTLNRTAKSFALGIVAAEHVLKWVPKGTHQWKKFIKPSELAQHCEEAGLSPLQITGMIFNPLKGEFEISDSDIDVNYFMSCIHSN